MVHLNELLRLAGVEAQASENPQVASVTDRLSEVAPGSLFVGIRGAKIDGSTLFSAAIERGAVAVASDHNRKIIVGMAITVTYGSAINNHAVIE